ncbi:MAG: alpha/beta hydrolase [Clostridia bacterium]|nr:alpha/beta hydrolase [Clostridia bacterium]
MFADKKKRKIFLGITIPVIILAIIFSACAVYLGDYYYPQASVFADVYPVNPVSRKILEDGTMVYRPENVKAGLIFYPGGKVDNASYEPLMKACTDKGILCVLVKMPFHLAVFDINAADGFQEKYPEVENWYIGGHSLGGSMAALHLSENIDSYEGLILLGSYSTADLSETDLDVLSVYGSEDKVLNREKYEENRINLPDDFTEFVIDGGCHAYFGIYGEQAGDGKATITAPEQILITAEKINELVSG